MTHVEGTVVRVHYRGTLEDGSEFDSSASRGPFEFTIGASEVLPAFESAVAELEVGENTTITLAPEDAYGPHYEQAVEILPFRFFTEEPYVGARTTLLGPNGERLDAIVTKVDGDDVTLDFNHPLAGRTLTFEIDLVETVPTT